MKRRMKHQFSRCGLRLSRLSGPSQHKPQVIRCDGAGEYASPKFRNWLLHKLGITLQHSNAHQQHQNDMAEKVGDKLVRRIRAALIHSGAPSKFWGAAILMAADVLNATPHASLSNDTPYHRQFGYHCDIKYFRPLACRCTVFRVKDLVSHRKIAARGISCIYLGTGVAFGRK